MWERKRLVIEAKRTSVGKAPFFGIASARASEEGGGPRRTATAGRTAARR
jgi:hypothetical protein